MEYQYPMNEDWTTEEAVDVIAFFQQVELAYEKGADREELLKASLPPFQGNCTGEGRRKKAMRRV